MNRELMFLGGLGLGAGVMYFLDPVAGRRRRALLRDQLASAANQLEHCAGATGRDISHRAWGLASEVASVASSRDNSDPVVTARVRSKMGRYVSHPGAIEVAVRDGHVTLSGPILANEVDDLLGCVHCVPGVRGVENRLEVHERPGNISALQGAGSHPGDRWNVMETNWAPATRVLAGAAGGALLGWGLTQRFPVACFLGTAGLALLTRAATNVELTRLVGLGGGRRAVDVHKTITIAAPREEVFRFWSSYANFPRFMAHLREVRDLGAGHSHWVAVGPAGMPISWNAVLTRVVPGQVLAWKSEDGSVLPNAGIIHFESAAGGTRVDIRLSYNPPAGALGHLAALLFGADPKSAMDEDLVRLKSLLEEGHTRAPGKAADRQELVEAGTA